MIIFNILPRVTAILFTATMAMATPIAQPSPAYISGTNRIDFSDFDESLLDSITDGFLTISFSSSLRASTVGQNWGTWGSPPDTESVSPRVLWTGVDDGGNPVTSVVFTLSTPVFVFGFEAEPGTLDHFTIVVSFFSAGNLQQTISRNVDGNGGALLFAASADSGVPFDSIAVSSSMDWAAGQFRYNATPEPATVTFVAAGLLAMILISRRGVSL